MSSARYLAETVLILSFQIGLGALVLGLLAPALRRHPRLEHGLWLLLVLKCCLPPVIPRPPIFGSEQLLASSVTWIDDDAVLSVEFVPDRLYRFLQWPLPPSRPALAMQVRNSTRLLVVLGLGWLVGCLVLAGLSLTRILRLRSGWGPVPVATGEAARRLAARMGLRQVPDLRTSDRCAGPGCVGLFRPTVLLPPAVVNSVNADQLQLILAHELAQHDMLRDQFANYLRVTTLGWSGDWAWIGLSDAEVEGTFVWLDGQPLVTDAWHFDEPNHIETSDDYVHYWRKPGQYKTEPLFTWNDASDRGLRGDITGRMGMFLEYE